MSGIHDQLCQIEQSMGVCHIAEFQPWYGAGRKRTASNSSGSRRGSRDVGERQAPTTLVALGQPAAASASTKQPESAENRGSGVTRGGNGQSSRDGRQSKGGDLGDERFDELDAAISWWVQGERDAVSKGAGRSSTTGLLCGRIPQQIADLRTHTRKLASHCDNLQVTTNHGHPLTVQSNSDLSLEGLEAAHLTVIEVARRLLQEGSPTTSSKLYGSPGMDAKFQ